jgi:hypothetical protein
MERSEHTATTPAAGAGVDDFATTACLLLVLLF